MASVAYVSKEVSLAIDKAFLLTGINKKAKQFSVSTGGVCLSLSDDLIHKYTAHNLIFYFFLNTGMYLTIQ